MPWIHLLFPLGEEEYRAGRGAYRTGTPNNNGVVWTVDLTTKELRANDANDISKILYINPNFGPAINWMVPTVINGHVYLGMKGEIISYSMH